MKRFLLLFSAALLTMSLCACGGGSSKHSEPIPEINPLDIITPEDVYAAVNYAYAPVLDGDTYTKDGNKVTAYYRSEPIGQGDPVIVEITQYTDTVAKEAVWYEYDLDRVMRSSAEMISDLGEDAFVAFPSIHVFDRGCHIKITAGSGNTDEQRNTLINLAAIAAARIDTIMPE